MTADDVADERGSHLQTLNKKSSESRGAELLDIGFSVVYEPNEADPVVDIVFIHGLQGHPFRTWTKELKKGHSSGAPQLKNRNSNPTRRSSSRLTRPDNGRDSLPEGAQPEGPSQVFWPRDLLPSECPDSRILVLGYDTNIARNPLSRFANKNSVFSHGKNLLNDLVRARPLDRPLIFVCHSLGGILAKEMLSLCHSSSNQELSNILECTAAIVFLGTPHRGSHAAKIGEIVRKAASALRMDTNPLVLQSLSLNNSDLERTQYIFSYLWQKHQFRVKTFQESLPINVRFALGSSKSRKIVPDASSSLGDVRERAESLDADHREMCRFSGANDPKYRKVGAELRAAYAAIRDATKQRAVDSEPRNDAANTNIDTAQNEVQQQRPSSKPTCLAILESLKFAGMFSRQQTVDPPARDTCGWLTKPGSAFDSWLNRRNSSETSGLLQITGKPGCGKSTLMKAAFGHVSSSFVGGDVLIASFFCNARGNELEHSSVGLLRSLLYQIVAFYSAREENVFLQHVIGSQYRINDVLWTVGELKAILQAIFTSDTVSRAILFIDALDECNADEVRDVGYYLLDLAKLANGAGVALDICVSRRDFPHIYLPNCPEIKVTNHNLEDVGKYVNQRFDLADLFPNDIGYRAELSNEITQRSNGVFLWVVIIVDQILRHRDEGMSRNYIRDATRTMPTSLEDVYANLLTETELLVQTPSLPSPWGSAPPRLSYSSKIIELFQWVLLAQRPLRVREWYYVLGLISGGITKSTSLASWRSSNESIETDDELERRIRTVSMGLIEVRQAISRDTEGQDADSMVGRAGSLDSHDGESRVVQPIHESVRTFFLHGNAYKALGLESREEFIRVGHWRIMRRCLDFITVKELEPYIKARAKHAFEKYAPAPKDPRQKQRVKHATRRLSTTSFCSSASSYGRSRDSTSLVFAKFDLRHTVASQRGSLLDDIESASSVLSGKSQTLVEYPPLVSYAVNMALTHGKLAEDNGAEPSRIVQDLSVKFRWHDLIALSAEPADTELLVFSARRGLENWVNIILDGVKTKSRGSYQMPRPPGLSMECPLWLARVEAVMHQHTEIATALIDAAPTVKCDAQYLPIAFRRLLSRTRSARLRRFAEGIKACFPGNEETMFLKAADGISLLHRAIHEDFMTAANILLDAGIIEINSSYLSYSPSSLGTWHLGDDGIKTPLHLAVRLTKLPTERQAHMDLFYKVLRLGADPNLEAPEGWTPLHEALWNADSQSVAVYGAVLALLDAGASPSGSDSALSVDTPLHLAAAKGLVSVVELLLDRGANINALDASGWSVLRRAIERSQPSVVSILISSGARVGSWDVKRAIDMRMTSLAASMAFGGFKRMVYS